MISKLRYVRKQFTPVLILLLILACFQFQPIGRSLAFSSLCYVFGKVIDANTGLPVANATILIWDMNALKKYICLTDENGEYNFSCAYLHAGHTYRIYAYKGDFMVKDVEYAASFKEVKLESGGKNVSFSLLPGALIELKGVPYLIQSSSPGGRVSIKVLNENGSEFPAPLISEYGNSIDAWFLGLNRDQVIVPANMPVILEAKIWFFSRKESCIKNEVFHIYDGSSPFRLQQGSVRSIELPKYSLRRGLGFANSRLKEIAEFLDEAQRVGFVIFEERRLLASIQQNMVETSLQLENAQNESDYIKIWAALRTDLGKLSLISRNVQNMRFISMTSAVYLPGVIAVFSIVLAFFLFEDEKKKMLSSIVIYVAFLLILYFVYPGTPIVINENMNLFLEAVGVSFITVSLLVFCIPRVWKERTVEGEVSWRSAVSIIFSMGKRQIRRRKMRSFFTILSLIILILGFTSLTSFGAVFGIVSERLNVAAPSDGIMVKRTLNQTSLLFSPIGSEDPKVLAEIMDIKNLALRYKNIPSSPNPVAWLVNPKTGKEWPIYGILAVTPASETIYSPLNETIDEGSYLDEDREDEVLIARTVAENLNVEVGENLTLNIVGAKVSVPLTLKGIINDEGYAGLKDIDGAPLGPIRLLSDSSARVCNSTEAIIMSWRTAEKIQKMINLKFPDRAPTFAVLSEIIFQPGEGVDLDSIVRTLIFVFDYDVFVASGGVVSHYYIGSYLEVKGAAELLIPLVMVVLNVSMVMLNSVYERRREIRTLSTLGLNPTHIGLIFLAEAIILGMVGGSLGYIFGLGFYRIMTFFGQELMVREKLEWWWSGIGFAIAILASVLSAIRPATLAISAYTPSKIRKLKIERKERERRREEIFKVYQARELSMPVKVKPSEMEFFIGFLINRLKELRGGYVESVDNLEENPEIETAKGELVKSIKFEYSFHISGRERRTKNSLILVKKPEEEYYRVRLVSEPAVPGMPEDSIDKTADFVHDIILYWAKNKERIIGG